MKVELAYGRGRLPVEFPDSTQVIEPEYAAAHPDPLGALRQALTDPIGSTPLKGRFRPADRVAIVHCDGTRPMPNAVVLKALGEAFDSAGIPDGQVTLLNALGTHRENTPEELAEIVGPEAMRRYHVVQSRSTDEASMRTIGRLKDGTPIEVHRAYVDADVRILLGFIEPHFFAGFSGGPKLVVPGVASQATVQRVHSAALIGSESATYGILDGNPLWEALYEATNLDPPTFIVNVALNRDKAITELFAGDLYDAHRRGAAYVREHAMCRVAEPFDIVVTTNSGFPLDQNLYQSVKGMSAAARVVRPGGHIVMASECSDGIPGHGAFRGIVSEGATPEGVLRLIQSAGFERTDQWQAQVLAMVCRKAQVHLYAAGVSHEDIESMLLHPIEEVEGTVRNVAAAHKVGAGRPARICVLPEGPQTIPYVEQ